MQSVLLVIGFIRFYQFYVSLGDTGVALSTLFIASLPVLIILYYTCSQLDIELLSLYLILHACTHDTICNA